MSTHTVSIRCRPATINDLIDGQVLLLPILNEHGAGYRVVTVFQRWYCQEPKFWFYDSFLQKTKPIPDFFPENCYIPCP